MSQTFRQITSALALVVFCAAPASASPFDEASLSNQARWKSFGVENWAQYDPLDRATPSREPVVIGEWSLPRSGGAIAQLKSLIAHAEAGRKGYDAVHVGARVRTPKRPTQMTLREVQAWIKRTPGQPHAIGRYQFIPSTLNALIKRAGLSRDVRFSPKVQDQLADLLLKDAGIDRFLAGRMSRTKFMNNLALIWAGLPKSNGKSAYHGYAGNRATITLKFFRAQMEQIFS